MIGAEHHHYFQMIEGGMACACGETIKAGKADLPGFLRATEQAMELEGISERVRERVINRLVYGAPDGPRPRVTVHVPPVSAQLDAIADSVAAVLAKMQATARPLRW